MNQAETSQFIFDLQLFADEPATEPTTQSSTEQPTEPQEQPTPQEEKTDTATHEDSTPDYSKLGTMQTDQQYEYLKKTGIFGNNKPNKPTEEKPEEQQQEKTEPSPIDQAKKQSEPAEPEYEIVVDGQKQKVKQSELIKLAQQGADYTKKTQSLAEQRRQVEALMAALQVQQQTNPQAVNKTKPQDKVQSEYQQAIAQAEKDLGIKAGEFNQFDPAHNFALQKVIANQNIKQAEQQAVKQEINDFIKAAQNDPLSPQIDANFDTYLFKLGTESSEGAQKAQAIIMAKQRLFNNQATKADTVLLKEHWNYVKQALSQPTENKPKSQPVTKPKPEPPKTETPGTGKDSKPEYHIDYAKFGHAKPQVQLEMLKKAGFLSRKKEG